MKTSEIALRLSSSGVREIHHGALSCVCGKHLREVCRTVVVIAKRVRAVNHDKNILIRLSLKRWAIKVRHTYGLLRWRIVAQIYKQRNHAFSFDHSLSNSNVVYVRHSRAGRQNILAHSVVHNVNHAHIEEAYVIVFFACSRVGQQIMHCICKRCSTSHNRGTNVHIFHSF